ncbi:MAG TPA: gliding motility-associated protein GldE [Saprospiraceae bacterium]|nr:gliding motility-associated protein GldE [Saprospiraceae bacterium]
METEPDSPIPLNYCLLLFAQAPPEALIGLLGVIALLISSGFISASEVAYFSLTPNDLDKLSTDRHHSIKRIFWLKDHPRRLLATILIGNNFVNIAIVILSEFVLRQLLPESTFLEWSKGLMDLLGIANADTYEIVLANVISFTITVVGVTFLLVLFGEIAPKVYARRNNIGLAKAMSGPLVIMMRIFKPLSSLLVNSTRFIETRLARSTQKTSAASKADIDEAIELTVSNEKNNEQEVDILKSIVKFTDVTARQIMTSRVDVVAVDVNEDYQELLRTVRESGYSRIPVYEQDLDNLKGILYVKDLIGHLHEAQDFKWQDLIRTNVMYVPEAKKISDLLKEFQKQHLHMAIVVDEYGGSSGIVTLEDILEEIIGDIQDEFDDEPEIVYRKLDDFNYLFEGKTLLNDVYRITGIENGIFDFIKGDADSLAGLILELHGQIPKKDTEVTYNHFRFKIVSVNKRRIEQVLITLPKSPQSPVN